MYIALLVCFTLSLSCYMLQKGAYPDLVATSGDYLRIWRVGDPEVRLECLLNNVSVTVLATVPGINEVYCCVYWSGGFSCVCCFA